MQKILAKYLLFLDHLKIKIDTLSPFLLELTTIVIILDTEFEEISLRKILMLPKLYDTTSVWESKNDYMWKHWSH